jgi:hypothetical protein
MSGINWWLRVARRMGLWRRDNLVAGQKNSYRCAARQCQLRTKRLAAI